MALHFQHDAGARALQCRDLQGACHRRQRAARGKRHIDDGAAHRYHPAANRRSAKLGFFWRRQVGHRRRVLRLDQDRETGGKR